MAKQHCFFSIPVNKPDTYLILLFETAIEVVIEFRISNGYKSFSRKPIFEALSNMCPISITYAKLNNQGVKSFMKLTCIIRRLGSIAAILCGNVLYE